MQVEMNGGIIVGIALMLIGVLAIGLIVYYVRKGREERIPASSEGEVAEVMEASSVADKDS